MRAFRLSFSKWWREIDNECWRQSAARQLDVWISTRPYGTSMWLARTLVTASRLMPFRLKPLRETVADIVPLAKSSLLPRYQSLRTSKKLK